MSRKNKNLRKAAAESQTAADKGAAAIEHAVAALSSSAAAVADYLNVAQEKVGPTAKAALGKSIEAAENARSQVEPRLADAYAKVSPSVDAAKHKLNERFHDAEQHPAVREVANRGAATFAALKGDLELPRKEQPIQKRGSVGKTIAKVLAAGALLAGAAVAVRQFLLSKDDGWTAHEPSPAYTPPKKRDDADLVFTTQTPGQKSETNLGDNDITDEVPVTAADLDATGEPVSADPDVNVEGDAVSDMVDEGGPVSTPDAPAAAEASAASYGEGAFVGAEPPAGYTIKGNERSKKYHVPESGGYERTIADVWFNSEEAAAAAGFTRAQR